MLQTKQGPRTVTAAPITKGLKTGQTHIQLGHSPANRVGQKLNIQVKDHSQRIPLQSAYCEWNKVWKQSQAINQSYFRLSFLS